VANELTAVERLQTTSGEVVPRRNRIQEKSYPKSWVRFLLEKSYSGTISSGEVVPSPGEIVLINIHQMLGTKSPGEKLYHFQS
jgi:hypothetical protein